MRRCIGTLLSSVSPRGKDRGSLKSARLSTCLWALACSLCPTPAVSQALYLAGSASLARIDTTGANWTVLAPGGPEWSFPYVAFDAQPGTVYYMLDWYMTGQSCVARLDNRGLWCDSYFISLCVDEKRKRLYVGTVDGTIRGCNFDGNGRTTLFSGGHIILGMDVDQSHQQLYWTDYVDSPSGGRVLRADILNDGFLLGAPETIAIGLGNVADVAIDVEGGKVYWVDYTRKQVQRANLDGSSAETIANTTEKPVSIAFDSLRHKVYWLESPQRETIVRRANPDGSGQKQLFRVSGQFLSLDLGPEIPVGIEPKGWDEMKQLYRGKAE